MRGEYPGEREGLERSCSCASRQLSRSLRALAALLMMAVNGSSWFTKRLQRVTPAAPTNTTSPGCRLNWLATAKADGDFASRWKTCEGVSCRSFEPRIT